MSGRPTRNTYANAIRLMKEALKIMETKRANQLKRNVQARNQSQVRRSR